MQNLFAPLRFGKKHPGWRAVLRKGCSVLVTRAIWATDDKHSPLLIQTTTCVQTIDWLNGSRGPGGGGCLLEPPTHPPFSITRPRTSPPRGPALRRGGGGGGPPCQKMVSRKYGKGQRPLPNHQLSKTHRRGRGNTTVK